MIEALFAVCVMVALALVVALVSMCRAASIMQQGMRAQEQALAHLPRYIESVEKVNVGLLVALEASNEGHFALTVDYRDLRRLDLETKLEHERLNNLRVRTEASLRPPDARTEASVNGEVRTAGFSDAEPHGSSV